LKWEKKEHEMKLSTLSLDHLGLVAGIFDDLGISEVINEAMPEYRRQSQKIDNYTDIWRS
jgi:hypothetical protein